VKELSSKAAALQQSLQATQDLCTLAASIYDAPAVSPDPFSPGLSAPRGKDARSLQTDAVDALGRLETADATRTDLYKARREAVSALGPTTASSKGGAKEGEESDERGARLAAEHGDADQLLQLAQKMLSASAATETAAAQPDASRTRFEPPKALSEPFPQSSLERAGALGLEPVESHTVAEVTQTVRDFLDRYGWGPATAELGKASDGVTQLRAVAREHISSRELAETAAETISLFATQIFVNSAGLRYVPLPIDKESCLIEGFPEGEEPVTELLKALGLPKRRGLTRSDIEKALLLHGPSVLQEHLGLDPREFRVVCVPPDIYLRVGRERGWGQRPEWTHFDGYRVLRSGQLLALVGGSSRYGGLVDLAGISATDERENVVARFAVVRRARLGARPAA
jgi:hypothetical protein